MSYVHEYPNSPDCQPTGKGDAAIGSGPEPGITRPRRRAKRYIVGALAIALVSGAAAGIGVAAYMRQSGSADPPTSSDAALQRWWAGAENGFTDMRNASEEVDQAFSHYRPGALAAACQHVDDAAEGKMRSHLPSPNRKLTAELNAAIRDFQFASHLCLAGVAGPPANYDGDFLALMAQANKHLQAAQGIIDRMSTGV